MTSAFDLDLEAVNEVQFALSDTQTERHDAFPQPRRNCEIVQLSNFVRLRDSIASGFCPEQADSAQKIANPMSPEFTPVEADQVGPNDDAPIVGSYLPSHNYISNNQP
jgi:hypothetical protein